MITIQIKYKSVMITIQIKYKFHRVSLNQSPPYDRRSIVATEQETHWVGLEIGQG
jgi:hypothetical protein